QRRSRCVRTVKTRATLPGSWRRSSNFALVEFSSRRRLHPKDKSMTIHLRTWGDLACFTRPEMKVERVSYPVITPSAARGLLEAILYKPQFRWRVRRIAVKKPIRFLAFRRNEVKSRLSSRKPEPILADEDRTQR